MNVDRYSKGIESFWSMTKNNNGSWVKFEDVLVLQDEILKAEKQDILMDNIVSIILDNKSSDEIKNQIIIDEYRTTIANISEGYQTIILKMNEWKSRAIILGSLLFIESLTIFYFY